MSRTHRRTHYPNLIKEQLSVWSCAYEGGRVVETTTILSPKSKEAHQVIARFCSDRGHGFHKHTGPSWFHLYTAQKPYRSRSKQAIHRFLRGHAEDVVLESKPRREYWD